jgi:hypothetical protein
LSTIDSRTTNRPTAAADYEKTPLDRDDASAGLEA